MTERVFELIREKGIKQKDLADALGISTGNISDWKSGRARPSIDVLEKLAEYFHVSIDYLSGRTDCRDMDDLIATYETGVSRWIRDRAFNYEQQCILKEHYFELLVRYKEIINALANASYSAEFRTLRASKASYEEFVQAAMEAVRTQIRAALGWTVTFPCFFYKGIDHTEQEAASMTNAAYKAAGVMRDDQQSADELSEDELDLLSIWNSLDKSGRRVLLGTAEEQMQKQQARNRDSASGDS